jgi:hypothetical protein
MLINQATSIILITTISKLHSYEETTVSNFNNALLDALLCSIPSAETEEQNVSST